MGPTAHVGRVPFARAEEFWISRRTNSLNHLKIVKYRLSRRREGHEFLGAAHITDTQLKSVEDFLTAQHDCRRAEM